MRKKVYISGPITKGDRNQNFYQAAIAEAELMRGGYAPFNPMRSMIMPHAWDEDLTHAVWLNTCYPWVAASDAVLRLPGESVGADAEVELAESLGIPVREFFVDIEKLFLEEIYPTVGLCGYAGSGKDTAAEALVARGYTRIAFADPVREVALAINPMIGYGELQKRLSSLVRDLGWTKAKKIPEVRRVLQATGTDAIREVLGRDTWVQVARRKRAAVNGPVVFTDCRFPNELEFIEDLGGVTIWIDRPGYGPALGHASETSVGPKDCHYLTHNTLTASYLQGQIEGICWFI